MHVVGKSRTQLANGMMWSRRLAGLEEKADGLQLKVLKRGAPPGGGGEVTVNVPVAKALPPVSLLEEGVRLPCAFATATATDGIPGKCEPDVPSWKMATLQVLGACASPIGHSCDLVHGVVQDSRSTCLA